MKKIITTIAIFTSVSLYAQNNVGIGTSSPNANAKLEINSDDKGVLITRLTTTARNTLGTNLTAVEDGMLVYDKDLTAFYYWDGPNLQWVVVGNGAGSDNQNIDTFSFDNTTNILTIEIEDGNIQTVDLTNLLNDGDADPTNEIELPATAVTGQVLSWDGTNWVAQNSASGADNWGNQTVVVTGSNVSGDGTTGNPITVTDGDSDATNEIELPTGGTNGQVLSTDGSGVYTWISDNAGTDDQNIANLAFDNTTNILTVGIENGNSQTIDLSSLVNDADNSITNEIQDLSINTTTNILTITNNGSATNIDLSSYLDNTDAQTLSLSGNTLTISNGNNVTLTDNVNDADFVIGNEYNTGATLSGTTLSITDGGGSQTVNLASLQDGTGTDNQDLTLTGNTLALTNDGTTVNLAPYLDNTDAQNITGSGFTTSTGNLVIGISNGTNQTVNLNGLKDHNWYEVGTTRGADNINDNIFTQGNVGIGMSTLPGEKLSVKGNIRVGGSSAGPNYIAFHGTTADGSGAYSHTFIGERIFSGSESSELFIYKGNDGATTAGPDRIRLAAADIVFDTYTGPIMSTTFSSIATNTSLLTRMVIKGTGNVGIGTQTPITKLQVSGDVKVGLLNPTNTGTFPAYGDFLSFSGGPAPANYDSDNSDPLWMARYNTASDKSDLRINIGDNNQVDDALSIGYTSGGFNELFRFDNTGVARKSGGGTWTATSDKRTKKDIVNFSDGLNVLSKINPVTFKYNGLYNTTDDGKDYVGIIAQEVKPVAPYMIGSYEATKTVDSKSKEEILNYDGGTYMLYVLVNSVKEQQEQIESQQEQIDNLMNELKLERDTNKQILEKLDLLLK